MSEQKIILERREILSHATGCDMGRFGKYKMCNCHYTDCLDYKDKYRNCICDILTAQQRYADYWMWRWTLPKWKKVVVWFRKPTVFVSDFIFKEIPKKIWY